MIIYITAVPGHGKSLRAMWYLNKPEFNNRPVYSNIEADTPTGIPKGHQPLPDDLRTVPDGSVIVVDEAQHRWSQRKPGSELTPEESWTDIHRHHGVDLILMTQRPTGVSHHIRGNVGRHEHLRRKMGMEASTIFRKDEAFNPNDRQALEECDQELWRFPRDLYGQYKSSVEHTGVYKFRLPMKAKGYLVAIGLLACIVGWFGWGAFDALASAGEEEGSRPAPQVEKQPLSQLPDPETGEQETDPDAVGVCIESAERCKCFRNNGRRADWTQAKCRNWSVASRVQ